jgi:hypothetical protein
MVQKIAQCFEDTRLVLLTDAAWGIREDGSSQGDYLILLCHKDIMLQNKTSP